MLDFNAAHVFYCAGKLGGIGAAARNLKVTQPAVSQRLRALERQLGKKLYGRAENRFVLTQDGQALFNACEAAFETLVSLEQRLEGLPEELQGTIRIASLSEFAKIFLLAKIYSFKKRYPAIRFQIEYRPPSEMMPLLLRNQVDMIFSKDISEKPQVESLPIFKEEYVLIGPRPTRRFSWKDLEKLQWLSARSEDNYWFEFLREASHHGIKLSTPSIEIGDLESLLQLASSGLGYALSPLHAVKLRNFTNLAIHKRPGKNFRQMVYRCRLRSVPASKAGELFWDSLQKHPKTHS